MSKETLLGVSNCVCFNLRIIRTMSWPVKYADFSYFHHPDATSVTAVLYKGAIMLVYFAVAVQSYIGGLWFGMVLLCL